jgi:HEAT repeat protein
MNYYKITLLILYIVFLLIQGCILSSSKVQTPLIDYEHPAISDIQFLIHQAISGNTIEDQNKAFRALDVLCSNENGKNAIIDQISSNNAQLRSESLSFLVHAVDSGLIEFKTQPVLIENVMKALTDEDFEVRSNACGLISVVIYTASNYNEEDALGESNNNIENLIITLLNDDNEDVRVRAVNVLIQFGQKAQEATGTLKTMLSDDYLPARLAAAVALAVINPTSTDAIHVLQEGINIAPTWQNEYGGRPMPILDYNDPPVYQYVAVESLALFGTSAMGAISDLLTLFDNDKFGEYGESHQQFILDTQDAVSHAIISIDPTGDQAIPRLIELLGESELSVRKNSAFTLGLYGSIASSAIPPLRGMLSETNQDVRSAAETAIRQIEN